MFRVVDSVPKLVPKTDIVLVRDSWDDYSYKTLFGVYIRGEDGTSLRVGSTKIGHIGQPPSSRTTLSDFERLPAEYFSLGQDVTYYETLAERPRQERSYVLEGLRDIVADTRAYDLAATENVTETSLFRFVSPDNIEQFRRALRGEDSLAGYDFAFRIRGASWPHSEMTFEVKPGSLPPTNIHALIGSNGVGKTWLLDQITRSLTDQAAMTGLVARRGGDKLSGIVTVSFSAFDDLDPRLRERTTEGSVRVQPISLRDESSKLPKSPRALAEDFAEALEGVVAAGRAERWLRMIRHLRHDPVLRDANFADLVHTRELDLRQETFKKLSSGHKIVLLSLTTLVQLVEERTLVLLDEPESHLHPPLLSAFLTALSDLLTEMNGVAIAATHSPIVLQEVPASCVWVVRRSGAFTMFERPENETYAENSGRLTQDVFGLEVTRTGYHAALLAAAKNQRAADAVIQSMGAQIGAEGRALLRAMVADLEDAD